MVCNMPRPEIKLQNLFDNLINKSVNSWRQNK